MVEAPGSGQIVLDDTVGSVLVGVARAHRALVGRGLAGLGLYPGQEFLLAQLWEDDDLPQTVLAQRLRVELPTVVKAVQRMGDSGLVSRRRDPDDRRVWRIQLTPQGRALRGPVERVWRDAEEKMLAGVTEADRSTLRRILEICSANLWATP